jgi:hypothetical protein
VALTSGRDRSHRAVIEAIKSKVSLPDLTLLSSNAIVASQLPRRSSTLCLFSKDTDAVIEAIESGMDPNLIDDVGQTLLNWAAAFGTNDMVQVRPPFSLRWMGLSQTSLERLHCHCSAALRQHIHFTANFSIVHRLTPMLDSSYASAAQILTGESAARRSSTRPPLVGPRL